uniref:Uncharacterized protein n=1 Tax=viral metagenome TaxID=1070528 RepID=A0A6C0CM63_9ZZZZ
MATIDEHNPYIKFMLKHYSGKPIEKWVRVCINKVPTAVVRKGPNDILKVRPYNYRDSWFPAVMRSDAHHVHNLEVQKEFWEAIYSSVECQDVLVKKKTDMKNMVQSKCILRVKDIMKVFTDIYDIEYPATF